MFLFTFFSSSCTIHLNTTGFVFILLVGYMYYRITILGLGDRFYDYLRDTYNQQSRLISTYNKINNPI